MSGGEPCCAVAAANRSRAGRIWTMCWPAVVNIKGVGPGQLHLDGATIAAIYLGDIAKWDDPAIKKLNPKLTLPSTAIAPPGEAVS